MRDPFLLPRPSVISYSGGRTSGMMLRKILDAFGGSLPDDILVLFCNTGKEREETLEFVHECETRWAVKVQWLEYRYKPYVVARTARGKPSLGEHCVEVVDYKTASRKGEPFEAIIDARKAYRLATDQEPILPNVVMRFCTAELKIRSKRRYMASLGHTDHYAGYFNAIGLRHDEDRRVSKLRASHESSSSDRCGEPIFPLYDAKLDEAAVMDFWSQQPFDLKLQSYEGNCDFCFLKARAKIDRLAREQTEGLSWWAAQEAKTGACFRRDRPTYTAMIETVKAQPVTLFTDYPDDVEMECHCTD